MRVGVVDLGTNSTRLLVADVDDGRVEEVARRTEITCTAMNVLFSTKTLASRAEYEAFIRVRPFSLGNKPNQYSGSSR